MKLFTAYFIRNKRLVIETSEPVTNYLKDNPAFIRTKRGKLVRIGSHSKDFSKTVVSVDNLTDAALEFIRAADKIRGKRTLRSLATSAQIESVKKLYQEVSKRKDNMIILPDLSRLTHGQIGRLKTDLEAILAKKNGSEN